MDVTYNPECTHNPMEIQCNQYPNPSHNLALPQFLAHHNCEDLDPTDTPSAIPTTIQAPKLCTHNPSTSQVKKSSHTNPVTLPYPPDPGEHVLEMSAAPTTLVERDKLDLSSLVHQKGRWEVLSVGHVLSRAPLQALYVLVNLHLESSNICQNLLLEHTEFPSATPA